jgi:hypothetical protein
VEALKRSLKTEWAKLPEELLRAAVDSVPKRFKEFLNKLGGLFNTN